MTRNIPRTMTRNTFTEAAQSRFFNAKKGVDHMACKHERIKSVNCVIYCDICGEKLPVDYLVGKDRIAAQKAAETAPEAVDVETPAAPVEVAETPAEGQKKTQKKTTARKKVTK